MNQTASRWIRPDPQSRAYRAAFQQARQHGLALDAARTPDCAVRNGRFWLTDPNVKRRLMQADTLIEIQAFLRAYRRPKPSVWNTVTDRCRAVLAAARNSPERKP